MTTTMQKPLLELTARDLMSESLMLVPREMSLPRAARLLGRAQVSGAPVIDADGRCVGVISAIDFLHRAERECDHHETPHANPGCICASWQILDGDALPDEAVEQYMTSDPVTAPPAMRIRDLARMMLDAHIHRVVIVDAQHHPIGVVSATDVLAAVARVDPAAESLLGKPHADPAPLRPREEDDYNFVTGR
jgi:CBS-domain-containing membrane protein